MSKLPSLTPRDVARILLRAGFDFERQKGSHRIYLKADLAVTLPWHNRDLKLGTLRHIIKQSGLTPEQFLQLK
jgi:predicted RNA binding protein YcfA (HicA-like mRNA interferase family)